MRNSFEIELDRKLYERIRALEYRVQELERIVLHSWTTHSQPYSPSVNLTQHQLDKIRETINAGQD